MFRDNEHDHSDADSFHSAYSKDQLEDVEREVEQFFHDVGDATPPDDGSKSNGDLKEDETKGPEDRFPPQEEASLLTTSHTHKTTGNSHFSTGSYTDALQSYDRALSFCPSYLDYESAVLRANMAACHLRLGEWKEAESTAGKAMEGLNRLDPLPEALEVELGGKEEPERISIGGTGENDKSSRSGSRATSTSQGKATTTPKPLARASSTSSRIEEIDDETAAQITSLPPPTPEQNRIRTLRTKALLRRAKARLELSTWTSLTSARTDYTLLLSLSSPSCPAFSPLSPLDRRNVDTQLKLLPARLDSAKQKEMSEMMGKLKELGNGILKPFGMSTDNFNFVKDEKSGGYSMQFNQGGKGGGK